MTAENLRARRSFGLDEKILLAPQETILRLEMNAAKWEEEARAAPRTGHSRALAAKRALRCRELAQSLKAEFEINNERKARERKSKW